MLIRKMLINDYENIYELWVSCTGLGLNNLDDSKEGIRRFLERNPDSCFVAEDEEHGKIIGNILAGNDGRRGYIYHTAVNPMYRKQGIAAALVNTALEALRSIGIHKIALVVFEKNETGNEFWGKMGFIERKDIVYRNKALVEMERIDT
ncbi:MAG: GNAT family N-acetyltransferase [Lachnospiraceae bacterium]|nr:GNAT family N-acetyltransferase [Lachnospiraceae bacterium]